MRAQIRVTIPGSSSKFWVSGIGAYGPPRWSTIADGGSEQVTWQMNLSESFTHPAMRAGALVEVLIGPAVVWSGIMAQPDISGEGWSFTAIGLSDEFRSAYLCLDSGGNTTSIPDVAVDQAIADGFPGTRPVSLSNVAFASTTQTDALNYVGDLLDEWATSVSKRWRVNADRTVTAAADPTTPTWFMSPGSTRIGLADDNYASNLYGRYKSGVGTYATVTAVDTSAAAKRRRAVPVDLTNLGVTTAPKATAVLTGMLAKGKARYAWTDAANPTRLQLTTPGGQPACLAFVKAGDMVRTFGVINEQGVPLPYFDWIIGKTDYEDGADTIQLAPTEIAARNLADVFSLAVS